MRDPEQQAPDPSGFGPAEPGDGEGAPDAEPDAGGGKALDLWGLRNSEPDIDPRDVGRKLDLGAAWYEHLFCGFMKQSHSAGAEAWMHYVVAMILLADRELDILDESERDELEDAAEDMGGFDRDL